MSLRLGASLLALRATAAQWQPENLPVHMPTGQYELEHYQPVAAANQVHLVGKNARFTVLTERLVRMEYSASGKFEDRATLGFLNRKTAAVHSSLVGSVDGSATATIHTGALTITYSGSGKFDASNLKVVGKSGAFKEWQPSMSNDGNLLGTIKSLDQIGPTSLNCTENAHIRVHEEDLHCTWGLVSRAGWSVYDDSNSPVLDETGWWGQPSADKQATLFENNTDTQDWYGFFHGHDYKAALADYVQVGGKIAMVPRQALGVWWTRWFDFNNFDVMKIVDDYESRGLPLDVFVLDMDWHMKNGWTGWTFDKQLFPFPADTLGYLKSRGLLLGANLHDAQGVGNWDRQYAPLAKFIGNPDVKDGQIQFSSCVNQKYAFGLEDIVLGALEKQGMDFWWIDWQQGGGGPVGGGGPKDLCEKGDSCGGCAGGMVNPTIWTDKIRATTHIRRGQKKRGIVLARWGGLGNHRYQVGFSGDVNPLAWNSFRYQPYFSSTASNVGYGFWSHDIEGPGDDHELYTRWIQFAAFSAVFRSHDRGMSGGGCSKPGSSKACSTVKPWNVPTKFFEANRDAMQTRAKWLPLIYNATREAYETGVSPLRPMYYEFPEENMAYAADMEGNFAQYFFCSTDVFVAPVVAPANITSPSTQYGGLARKTIWVPPGSWLEVPTGHVHKGGSSVTLDKLYDITEIPVFVRAGAMLPSVPLRLGKTIGHATHAWEELVFTVYQAATSGSSTVYEDDGNTTDYVTGVYARTHAAYTTKAGSLSFTVSTHSSGYAALASRAYTLKVVNGLPPSKVTADGNLLPFSRYPGSGGVHPRGTWHFDAVDMAVVVNAAKVPTSGTLTIVVEGVASSKISTAGMKGQIMHAVLAKDNIDETRTTPGAHDPYPGGSDISQAASSGQALAFMAGNDVKSFAALVNNFTKVYAQAVLEIQTMVDSNKNDTRLEYSLAALKAAL